MTATDIDKLFSKFCFPTKRWSEILTQRDVPEIRILVKFVNSGWHLACIAFLGVEVFWRKIRRFQKWKFRTYGTIQEFCMLKKHRTAICNCCATNCFVYGCQFFFWPDINYIYKLSYKQKLVYCGYHRAFFYISLIGKF